MTKPKLLIISDAKAIGGGEVYLKTLIPQLSRQYNVTLMAPRTLRSFIGTSITTKPLFAFPALLEKLLPRNYQLQRLYYWALFKVRIPRTKYAIVNVQWFDGAVIESIKSRPLVLTLHTGINLPQAHNQYIQNLLNSVAQIICVSQSAKDQLVSRGVIASQCSVVPNGVNVKKYSFVQRPGTYVTWVGRVEETDKNPLLFLKIAKEAKHRGLSYQFRLVGDGSYLPALKTYAKQNQLDNISFTGHVPSHSMYDIYKDASLLCLTSTSESLPLAILEAMACGVPVVATDVGGVSEIISTNQVGVVVDDFSASSFVQAIDAILSKPVHYEKIRHASRKRVETHFSEQAMIQGTLRVYNEVRS